MSQIYGITKSIELPSGVELSFWVANIATAEMQNNRGQINFYGYASKAAFESGKTYGDCRQVEVKLTDITGKAGDFDPTMGIYDAMWLATATTLISLESSVFYGGVLEQATIPPAQWI